MNAAFWEGFNDAAYFRRNRADQFVGKWRRDYISGFKAFFYR